MSSAVKPFTVCSTLMESGVRGSKKRTSPFTLTERKSQQASSAQTCGGKRAYLTLMM